MERRKILLGSGAALATVLAGCSSDETGDESNDDDDTTDDGNGGGNGDGNTDDTADKADVPGLDRDKLHVDSDKISIEDVSKDGDKVDVVATTTTTDPETLRTELHSLGESIAPAITDPEAFAAAVDSVTWVLEKDGAKVMSFYVDVQWALAYVNGEMDDREFAHAVLETADEH